MSTKTYRDQETGYNIASCDVSGCELAHVRKTTATQTFSISFRNGTDVVKIEGLTEQVMRELIDWAEKYRP